MLIKLPQIFNMDSPRLMLSLDQETNNLCLFNVKNRVFFTPNALKNLQDFPCIGSSHGWLGFLNEKSNPFLLNPFSNIRIILPEKQTLPNVDLVRENDNGTFQVMRKQGNSSHYSHKNHGQLLITKTVLSSNPLHNKNYTAIIIYKAGCNTNKLAFCRHGDEIWSDLEGSAETYYDVVCSSDHTNMVFALGQGPLVEVWDLNKRIPIRRTIIQDSCPRKLMQANVAFPYDLYSSQWYLSLSSSGQIYFVVRYIGEFVRYDGEVVSEGDTLTDYASEPLVCPYRTVEFHVYKADVDRKIWTVVESLNDVALFLGGNHSMALSIEKYPGLRGNSIYFTDDYWDRIDEDYSYGGHDMGIFNLGDGSIEPLVMDLNQQKIQPPPFWITRCSSSSL